MEGGTPLPSFLLELRPVSLCILGGRLLELRLYNEDVRKRSPFMKLGFKSYKTTLTFKKTCYLKNAIAAKNPTTVLFPR